MTSEGQGAPHSRRFGHELVTKPAISLKKNRGGYRRTTVHEELSVSPDATWLRRHSFAQPDQHLYALLVVRLGLGKLLVNLSQVVKRTNTPLITLKNGVVGRTMGFLGSWVRIPPSAITLFFHGFPMSNLKMLSRLPGIPRK